MTFNEDIANEKATQRSESKWIKILMIIGSVVTALCYAILATYGIIGILGEYFNLSSQFQVLFTNSIQTFNIAINVGVLLLLVGFIGLARLVNGVPKILLIVSSIGFGLVILSNVTFQVLKLIFIVLKIDNVFLLEFVVEQTFFIITLFLITMVFTLLSFVKCSLKDNAEEFNLLTISSFISQLWIVAVLVTFLIFLFTAFGGANPIFYLASLIALGLTQIAQSIEFSVKVSKI